MLSYSTQGSSHSKTSKVIMGGEDQPHPESISEANVRWTMINYSSVSPEVLQLK